MEEKIEKTYTESEMKSIVEKQVLMQNITGFFMAALTHGRQMGMTEGMLYAGDYCYRLIMAPEPEKAQLEPGTD